MRRSGGGVVGVRDLEQIEPRRAARYIDEVPAVLIRGGLVPFFCVYVSIVGVTVAWAEAFRITARPGKSQGRHAHAEVPMADTQTSDPSMLPRVAGKHPLTRLGQEGSSVFRALVYYTRTTYTYIPNIYHLYSARTRARGPPSSRDKIPSIRHDYTPTTARNMSSGTTHPTIPIKPPQKPDFHTISLYPKGLMTTH